MAKTETAAPVEAKAPKLGAKAGRRLDEIEKAQGKATRTSVLEKATEIAVTKGDKLVRIEHVYEAAGEQMPEKKARGNGAGKGGPGNSGTAPQAARGAGKKSATPAGSQGSGKTASKSSTKTAPEAAPEDPPEAGTSLL